MNGLTMKYLVIPYFEYSSRQTSVSANPIIVMLNFAKHR